MNTSANSWIGKLTGIVMEIEQAEQLSRELLRDLSVSFFNETLEICRAIEEIYSEEAEDADSFPNTLLRTGENLSVLLMNIDRSSGVGKDEICYEMCRFISLLSQRINFEKE